MHINSLPPLSLYVHIPWCVKKCPYCDFNSHTHHEDLPVEDYVAALMRDLQAEVAWAQGRPLQSIFFGGGTPSLFPNEAIARIIEGADQLIGIDKSAEITLEANPGTVEFRDFRGLRAAGVNRLSLGVQSFNDTHLRSLGRIHNRDEASKAFALARQEGFDNINLDLMHGLPEQNLDEALEDLTTAIALDPEHISWYQLTIEANTEFFSRPPRLPHEDALVDIFEHGQRLLIDRGFGQYEVSAYAKPRRRAAHNLNYWQFGDYLAVGAGAHGKSTRDNAIYRYRKTRLPKDYLAKNQQCAVVTENIAEGSLPLEFMMNALRLSEGVASTLFGERTGLEYEQIEPNLLLLRNKGLLVENKNRLCATPLGHKFLNTLLDAFQ